MTKPLNFQQIMLNLQQYWADHGCTIWQPYHESVGAGTGNPATALRVLGGEPWNVAYVEPSFRPDDGRYGDNPNRMQMFYQFQVILQPDPGNPQELYLGSLEALGLQREEHDIRFVEDNWESPALGAWGLGWEVWLDGMEISQYTYFQQSGGQTLDPVAVELTYGLERIAMYLQGVKSVWDLDWDGRQTYRDILHRQEVEYCRYNFEEASIESLAQMYNLCEQEALRCLERGLVVPAHDYVLKCSHVFNVLDTRGAIGVTERAAYFGRMRRQSQSVAKAFVAQREELGLPLLKFMPPKPINTPPAAMPAPITAPADFLLEIGTEELPSTHVTLVIEQLQTAVPALLAELRLEAESVYVSGTPRRQTVIIKALAPRQPDLTEELRGPAAKIAFDADGNPTKAAIGFARGKGVDPAGLFRKDVDGLEYVFARKQTPGRPAAEVLAEALPGLLKGIGFPRSMRWLSGAQFGKDVAATTYSRPIRWLVALLGNQVVPFAYAGLNSGRVTRGLRPEGSPDIQINSVADYLPALQANRIILDVEARRAEIKAQISAAAATVNGVPLVDASLLEEVTNLVEQPTALIGSFDEAHLQIPAPVLVTVMKKHQRYFPVFSAEGNLLPCFVVVRNGGADHLDKVRAGNEGVLIARYADAEFFFKTDSAKSLADFLPRLDTLIFQKDLGSMLDKTHRLEALAPQIGAMLGLSTDDLATVSRAAQLCKADLATQMVVELTSLQGQMGYEYALRSGETPAVAVAIKEHYLPAGSGDALPQSKAGVALSLANRLDSLIGLSAVGLLPSGNKDPFALRREALGLVTILMEQGLNFSVRAGLEKAAAQQPVPVSAEVLAETAAFVTRRLEGLLRDRGLAHDVVNAVLAERGDNPALALAAAIDLTAAVAQPGWETVLNAYARCVRLVRNLDTRYTLQPAALAEPASQALYAACVAVRQALTPASSLSAVIEAIRQTLVGPINTFFDEVLVMVEDEAVRQNRLALLQDIRALTAGYADFSELQGF